MNVQQKLRTITFQFDCLDGIKVLIPIEGIFNYSDQIQGDCADIAATTILYISQSAGGLKTFCAAELSQIKSPKIKIRTPAGTQIETTMLMFGIRLLKDRSLIKIIKTGEIGTIIPTERLLDAVLVYLREKKRSVS